MPAAERRTAAHAAASGLPERGRRGQRVCVPCRLVTDAAYHDRALSVYVKIAALSARREGCTAAVEVIAGYLGMPKSSVEKGIRQLINPWGAEQLVEVPTRRRTRRGGDGDTAARRVRPLAAGELYVWLPVAAAEVLRPRLLRLYAAITHATARRMPITYEALAGLLGVTPRRVGTLVGELETLGWLTVHRRAGERGRHLYEPHPHPLHSVPRRVRSAPAGPQQLELPLGDEGPAKGTPELIGGSGHDHGGGSLAIEEDQELTDSENPPTAVATSRRRRQLPVARGHISGLAARTERSTLRTPTSPARTAAPPGPPPGTPQHWQAPEAGHGRRYSGPPLALSPRVWRVLEPVHDLLPGIRPFLLRGAAREIGRQLGPATDPHHVERIRRRIESRRARLDRGRPHDPGVWLLHAALPVWGCGLEHCEDGWLHRPWAPGAPIECAVCAEQAARRRLARRQHARLAAGLCPHHGTPPTRTGACPGCVVDRACGVLRPELLPPPDLLPGRGDAA